MKKKNTAIWFAVLFAATLVYFTHGYCDDAPEGPGDSGVTDAVTPRFVKPGKVGENKNVFAEPAKAEEPKKAPDSSIAENAKKVEEPKKESFADKLKNFKNRFKTNKADAKKAQGPKMVESDRK